MAEMAVKRLTLYSWLHYRFEVQFPDQERAQEDIARLNKTINKHLEQTAARKCATCGKKLPWQHPHANCDGCFGSRGGRGGRYRRR
jgi:hypothetical protein